MSDRVINFAAGPATLPQPVLEEVRQDLLSLPGVGASALEVSHRGPWFEGVIAEAEANLRALLAIHRGNVSALARQFGKARMQVHRWLSRYALDPESFRAESPASNDEREAD